MEPWACSSRLRSGLSAVGEVRLMLLETAWGSTAPFWKVATMMRSRGPAFRQPSGACSETPPNATSTPVAGATLGDSLPLGDSEAPDGSVLVASLLPDGWSAPPESWQPAQATSAASAAAAAAARRTCADLMRPLPVCGPDA